MHYWFIGLGGALGAMARVALSSVLPPFIFGLPLRILCVNMIGCLAFGVLTGVMALYWSASTNVRHFLVQGFLGGFTTFSAFSLEFASLYERGFYGTAFVYLVASVVLSIICFFFLGLKVVRIFA